MTTRSARRWAGLLAGLTITIVAATEAQATDGGPRYPGIVGVWYATSSIIDPVVPIPLQRIFTIHADRTFTGTDVDDQGFLGSAINGPIHGVWRRVRRGAYEFTGLFFNYDADGTPLSVSRVRATVHRAGAGLEGDFSAVSFDLAGDPLDPAAEPLEDSFKRGELILRRLGFPPGH